jgi:hypothetical protein
MTKIYHMEFPFEEIRQEDGNYFDSEKAAQRAGFTNDHIWSIVEEDGVLIYGPSYHYVNRIGYIATAEAHDGMTYYEVSSDGEG